MKWRELFHKYYKEVITAFFILGVSYVVGISLLGYYVFMTFIKYLGG